MSEEHYFTADPSAPFTRTPVDVEVWGEKFTLDSGSGVFAHGRADIGTSVLLRETEPPGPGLYLDLGCGYGLIGLAILLAQPEAQVHAVDVNERALRLARENAERLGVLDRLTAGTDLPAASYDGIWSNPPIRIGKPALHELLLRWLPTLAPQAAATMVVGKNLGADSLARWLGEQGWATHKLASAKGFRVLRTQRQAG